MDFLRQLLGRLDRRVNLNTLFPSYLLPEKSDAAVLAWFWLSPWLSPCLVPFRGKGDDDSRADEPELHTGVAAADQPGPARLGRALARHLLRLDLMTDV